MNPRPHVIVGTAGHIDHGKSALVKALTGTDPDSLPEEKERGLTIDLGFVFMDLPGYEKQIVFIDVPGHEKFVKTMVAGASHIDVAMLVIAADEGLSVQTREHFDILSLLDLREGIIVLTKMDLPASREGLPALRSEVAEFVKGSFLESAPVVAVSALTGEGMDELKKALVDSGLRLRPRPDTGRFRMPIDRVFSIQGFGTVVAGTVLSGEIRAGDRIEILPDSLESRVRGVQVHKEKQDFSGIGKRTALNLLDIDKDRLRRGQVAAAPGFLTPVTRIDARLKLLNDSPFGLKTRSRVRLHVGTDEVIARVILLEKDELTAGESGLVQFVFESPTSTLPGDRYIVRTFSPVLTIGGGTVLDQAPVRHKRFDPAALEGLRRLEGPLPGVIEQAFKKAAPASRTPDEISISRGLALPVVEDVAGRLLAEGRLRKITTDKGPRFLPAEAWSAVREAVLTSVRSYLKTNPLRPAMPLADLRAHLGRRTDEPAFRDVLDSVVLEKALVRGEGTVSLPSGEAPLPAEDQADADRVEAAFRGGQFEPASEDDVCRILRLPLNRYRKVMGSLLRQGKLIRLDPKVIYHKDAYDKAKNAAITRLRKDGSLTIAGLKAELGTSRKFACALLEHFDATGLTRREGDAHVIKR
jgi:selenocysteine-specific elongation factor